MIWVKFPHEMLLAVIGPPDWSFNLTDATSPMTALHIIQIARNRFGWSDRFCTYAAFTGCQFFCSHLTVCLFVPQTGSRSSAWQCWTALRKKILISAKSSASSSTRRSRYVAFLHIRRHVTFHSDGLCPASLFSISMLTVQRQSEGRLTEVRLCPPCPSDLPPYPPAGPGPPVSPLSVCPGADREIQSVRQLMVNILQNHTKLDWPDQCPTLGPYRYQNQSFFFSFFLEAWFDVCC